jgi:hypothetical protein
MHLDDVTTGPMPVEPTHEIDDTELSDEALDRPPGRREFCSAPSECSLCCS